MEHNRRWTDTLGTKIEKTERLATDGRILATGDRLGYPTMNQINEFPLTRADETVQDREIIRASARKEVARLTGVVEPPQGEGAESRGSEVDGNKRLLSPEQTETTLGIVRRRFLKNMQLHKGVEWAEVEASLKASPEAIWSLAQMASAGHEPDVYHDDDDYFYFGTCSGEVPWNNRDCAYNQIALEWEKEDSVPPFANGSAVEMAEAMGISLMPPSHYYNILQKKGDFDEMTTSWLLRQLPDHGLAVIGWRDARGVHLEDRVDVTSHYDNRGWRGSLKVKKVAV